MKILEKSNTVLRIQVQFSSVELLSRVRLFVTSWTAAHQASLSITNSQSPPKPMSLSRWCHPTFSSSVIPFSSCPQSFPGSGPFLMSQLFAYFKVLELQHQSFHWIFRVESFRIDWLDLLAVQGTLKTLLQHHSSKASILQVVAMVQFTSIHNYWKNHSFDYIELSRQNDVSAFEYTV